MKTKYMSKGGPMKRGYAPVKKQTFGEAFAEARKNQGAGGTFTFKGKKYSTNRADDKKKKEVKKSVQKENKILDDTFITNKRKSKVLDDTFITNRNTGITKKKSTKPRSKIKDQTFITNRKKGGKISDGTNFVARQYGGKIGK